MYETIKTMELGPVSIEVRIWHDPAYGMSAEPLSYRIGDNRVKMRAGATSLLADQLVASIVAEHYDDQHLEHMLADDPAFECVDYDEDPCSQQEFQHMRI